MPQPPAILVIDDEQAICFAFQRYFGQRGHAVEVAASCREGLARYRGNRPDVVFLDVRLPDGSGLDVLEQLRAEDPDACVIVMTAYGSLETVTRAVRGRAFDYLVKPLDLDRADELVRQATEAKAIEAGAAQGGRERPLAARDADAPSGATLVGASAAMQEVYKRIGKVASSDASVLVRGATGTGKELVARAIHEHSSRRDRPFVAVNCAALPEHLVESELFGYVRGAFTGADADKPGRFELADRGTLFLDEVGELPLAAQVKLLRFLDEQTVERLGSVRSIRLDVRVLAASNRDLARAIADGQFRDDLFYRLAVVQIDLPPLAERVEDILPLAEHFLARSGRAAPISADAADLLADYDWPGNVRELRNAVEHAAVVSGGGAILPAHLPETVRGGRAPAVGADAKDLEAAVERLVSAVAARPGADGRLVQLAVSAVERALIGRVLAETGGNQSAAAARLGLHRNTLRAKLQEHGLTDDAPPARA